MKKMTCRELQGACDLVFEAETFEEMVELSKKHGMEMFKANDAAHLAAMTKVKESLQTPEAMKQWMIDRRKAFENAPDA